MNPKVSIIVPVYNVERYLDRCVKSLLGQTLKDVEIILVDDKSPDDCSMICDQYAIQDARIKVVHKNENEGLGEACNSGILAATGDYLAFCDSDDWVEPEMYEELYHMAIVNNADVVFSGIRTVNDKGVITPMNEPNEYQVINSKEGRDILALEIVGAEPSFRSERRMAMSAKIVLYKRQLIEDNELRFVSERKIICEDLMWNIDVLAHANTVVRVPHTWYNYYCSGENTLTRKLRKDRFDFFKIMREAVLKKCQNYKYPSGHEVRVDRLFIGYSRAYIKQLINSELKESEIKELVISICKDPIWEEIWKQYPIGQMYWKHFIMAIFMKYHFYQGMKMVCRMK